MAHLAGMEGMEDYTYLLEMMDAEDAIGGLDSNYSLDDFLRVSMDYQQEDHWFSATEETCLILFFVFFMILGLVGNGLVCFIIISKGSRQSSRNWYILNLALSDILTCVLCKPLTLVRLMLKNWPLGTVLCKLVPSLQTLYVFVSTLTLVALAVDRYRAVMCTHHYHHRGVFLVTPCYCLGVIWVASIAMALPIFLVHRLEEVRGFGGYVLYTVCLEQWHSQSSLTVYTVFVLLLQYLSPLTAIVTLHLLIGKFLRMRIEAGGSSRMPDPQLRRKRKRHRKNMWMLISMAVAFAVAWLPLHLVNALASFDYQIFQRTNFPLIHASSMLVAFSSVCLNPVIYGLLNSNFRRDLRRLLCRRCLNGYSGGDSGGGGFSHGGGSSAASCRRWSAFYRRRSSSGGGGGARATERCGLISSSVAAGLPEFSPSAVVSVMLRGSDGITSL